MNINLEYYKVFYTVVKTGSISAAAGKLFISQPAVSQAIKNLETALGARLFLRTSRGVRLTGDGERLFTYVSRGYEAFLTAEELFKDIHQLESGELRIGASDMTLQFYLLPHLERFHSLYPKVKISVTNGPTPVTLDALRDGTIDFGAVTSPVEDAAFHVRDVARIRDCFVAGRRFERLRGGRHPLSEVAKLPLIMLERGTSSRSFIDKWFSDHNVEYDPEFELATSPLIVQFAKRGLGVGYVVDHFAQAEIAAGTLFEVPLQELLPSRNICLVTSRRHPVSTAGRRMLELLEADIPT